MIDDQLHEIFSRHLHMIEEVSKDSVERALIDALEEAQDQYFL